LLQTIDKEPQELGYEFGRWTGELLATYLASKTGIELSGSQVSRILKKKKYSYIWAKYSREYQQNPAQRTKFNQKLLNYLHRAIQQHFCRYRYGFGMRAGLVYES
jgi:transposase